MFYSELFTSPQPLYLMLLIAVLFNCDILGGYFSGSREPDLIQYTTCEVGRKRRAEAAHFPPRGS